jgi:hypothetical protein
MPIPQRCVRRTAAPARTFPRAAGPRPSGRARRLAIPAAGAAIAAVALPASACAHGLAGTPTPGLPNWLFAWGGAIVLVVSFVALSTLWQQPRLQRVREHARWRVPRAVDPLCGAIGVALFVGFVYAGLAGSQDTLSNVVPTATFVAFWVVVPILSGLLGDVFKPFNPWRATARGASWLAARLGGEGAVSKPLPYPAWLGRWPAAIGLVAFGWIELVYVNRDDPSTLAVLAIAYAVAQLVAMSLFGREAWERQGDPFGVYFGLFARLSPLHWHDGRLATRPPLSGVTGLDVTAGTVALVCATIGVTTFDGLSAGPLWTDVAPSMQRFFEHRGLGIETALEAAFTVGLIACILVVGAFYAIGVRGVRTIDRQRSTPELARAFVHTLVPIALAYVVAHYLSLVLFQGQGLIYMASDPLGRGWNALGSSSFQVDYSLVGPTAIWYGQVAGLLGGHVCGLVLAHDRALALFPRGRDATRSQYWMLIVMVGFTNLGMWLISAANQ